MLTSSLGLLSSLYCALKIVISISYAIYCIIEVKNKLMTTVQTSDMKIYRSVGRLDLFCALRMGNGNAEDGKTP